jgi:hypothetical protein
VKQHEKQPPSGGFKEKQMSRKFLGERKPELVEKERKRYLNDSESKLKQLENCLNVLKEAGVEYDLVQKLYDRELARKARLTKLLKEGDEIRKHENSNH